MVLHKLKVVDGVWTLDHGGENQKSTIALRADKTNCNPEVSRRR